MVIEQFLAILVGLSDSIMVASVGEYAVSGVSLVDNIFVSILFGNVIARIVDGLYDSLLRNFGTVIFNCSIAFFIACFY